MPKDVSYEDEFEEARKQAVKDRKEKLEKGTFKLPTGDTTLRILSTPSDKQRDSRPLYMYYYQHSNVGPNKRTVRCGKSVPDEEGTCWLCDKIIAKLQADGETKRADDLKKYKVYATNVAVYDPEVGEFRGPLFWPVGAGGKRSVSWILESIITNPKARKYLDHKSGYNYTINRVGMKWNDTVYTLIGRDEEPSEVPNAILKRLKPFVDTVRLYDAAEQKRVFYGMSEEEEAEAKESKVARKRFEEDEEDSPRPKKRAAVEEDEEEDTPAPKKRAAVVDEEDEEETPAPKKKRQAVVDEEDEEETPAPKKRAAVEEDEDEEETPRPKKRAAVLEEDEDEDLNFGDEDVPKRKKKTEFEEEEDELEAEAPKADKDDAEDEEEEEDEDFSPKKKRAEVKEEEDDFGDDDLDAPKPKSKKRAAVAEEDEDEEDTPPPKKRRASVEEDEDEEPAPKKRKVVAVEEDVEEEEEVPVRKKRKAAMAR